MRKAGIWLAGLAIVAALLLLTPVGRIILGSIAFQYHVRAEERKLQTATNCQPAAVALARICQSDASLYADEGASLPAWAPQEIITLRPSHMRLTADGARVEFGGGFHHLGYLLFREEASDGAASNQWKLYFYSEGSKPTLLHTFSLAKTDVLSKQQFLDRVLAEDHRRAAGGFYHEREVQARLKLLLRLGEHERARAWVKEFAGKYPADWLDQLLAFWIDWRTDRAGAAARLNEWAAKGNDYSSWMYAAFAYRKVGDVEGVERCARSAAAAGATDAKWSDVHARVPGIPIALYLLQSKQYETCEKLCDALLAYKGAREHLVPEIGAIRKRAQAGIKNERVEGSEPALERPFDPFSEVDLVGLVQGK